MSGVGQRDLSRVEIECVAVRAIHIYEQSVREADGSFPEYIESGGDGHMWLLHETRGAAAAYFAGEYGCDFTQVRVTREYMRINRDAIRDEAAALAVEWEECDSLPIAYTWQGEGWLYATCKRGDPGSLAFWRCEEKSTPKGQDHD